MSNGGSNEIAALMDRRRRQLVNPGPTSPRDHSNIRSLKPLLPSISRPRQPEATSLDQFAWASVVLELAQAHEATLVMQLGTWDRRKMMLAVGSSWCFPCKWRHQLANRPTGLSSRQAELW